MGETPESCIKLFKCMLKSLVKYKRKLPSIADATKEKFDYLINHVAKEDQKDFCEFDINQNFAIRCFYRAFSYKTLTHVSNLLMTF